MYVHAQTHIMIRSSLTRDNQCRHVRELLDRCNLLIGASIGGRQISDEGETQSLRNDIYIRSHMLIADMRHYAPIARELIAFWPQLQPSAASGKEKTSDAVTRTLTDWLYEHPESALVLLFLHVTMNVLGKTAPEMGLKLLDCAILAYFQRRLSCDWRELSKWLVMPANTHEYLYATPTSDATSAQLLTLNAHLYAEMSQFKSAKAETQTMLRLGDYLQSIKPK